MSVIFEESSHRSVLGEVKCFETCSFLGKKKKKNIPAICAVQFPEMGTKININ